MSPTSTSQRPSVHRRPSAAQARARERARRRMILIAGAAVLVVAALVGLVVQSARSETAPPAAGAVPAPLTANGGLQVGTGPVTVDLYTDFQCPACQRFDQLSGDTVADLVKQGKVTVSYHPMSFLGPESVRAANAATAAYAQGRLLEYAEVLYANRPAEHAGGYKNDELVIRARQAGVPDLAAFETDVATERYRAWVLTVNDEASKQGVSSTPTVLVAGTPLKDTSPAGLRAAVAAATP